MTFYERLTELCSEKGITVNGLIIQLKMSKSNGKSWREGAVPQAATLKKIADYFGVDVDNLTGKSLTNMNVQTVNDNHGVIGQVDAPVHINTNMSCPQDDEMKSALCTIFDQLNVMDKARLLLYANDLLDGKGAKTDL